MGAAALPASAAGRGRAGPGPRAAGGAAQHVKKIQHVRKAHSSYAIFAVLDEIDVLSSRNLPGKPEPVGKPGGVRPAARDAERQTRESPARRIRREVGSGPRGRGA